MNIWIVNPYGTLPSEGWREYRSSMLARALVERGHRVTWFISDFEHRAKMVRPDVRSDPTLVGVTIYCLPTKSYVRNISIGRIQYERSFGRAFAAISATMECPDCIVLGEPALFFGGPVRRFARYHDIALIVDILDLWPEMFSLALPKLLRPAGKWIFGPLYARRRRLLREAAAVAACTADYAVIARSLTARPVATFYLGVDVEQVRRSMAEFPAAALLPAFDGLTCVYAGTLGNAYDVPCLAASVAKLAHTGQVRVIVAGAGPEQATFQKLAQAYPDTLIFLGEIRSDALSAVYAQADIGLCGYAAGSTVSMPVKLFDYLAAGLGIVTSLEGKDISELLAAGVGVRYPAGNSDALADTLLRLALEPDRVASIRQVAANIGEQFDQKCQHDAYSKFIESTVVNKAT